MTSICTVIMTGVPGAGNISRAPTGLILVAVRKTPVRKRILRR